MTLSWQYLCILLLGNQYPGKDLVIVGYGILIYVFLYILVTIIIAEIYARMSYNRWFYSFTEDGLRLERGIIARILGFSSVMIQTAGYSGTYHSEGYIPAVNINEAEKIRELVLRKITKSKKLHG